MIERIVVPLDGSGLAEEILPHVRKVLRRADSEVILVRAAVPPPLEDSMGVAEATLAAAREYLRRVQDGLVEQGVRVASRAYVGSAVGVILDVAEREGATMIALASHGQTGLKRLLLGSVAENVLRKSPGPVLVARPFWSYELLPPSEEKPEGRPIRTILLPLGGSDLSSAIVPPVTDLANLFDSRLVLLGVVEATDHRGGDDAEAVAYLNRFSKELEREGLETLSVVRRGKPAQEILEAVPAYQADLIAMATHGRSGLSRLVTGSVTEKVLREAPCPMLVVGPTRAARSTMMASKGSAGR